MNTFLKYSSSALALLGLALSSCQPDLESPKASAGSADFTRYIAVGNSLTAGFSDGGLYREGQFYSYPNILATQFSQVGGGAFNQPLFSEAQFNGSGYLRLASLSAAGPVTANVTTNLATRGLYTPPRQTTPLPIQLAPRPLYTKFLDPINNLGVPGIRLADIETVGYASQAGNPYLERITPDAQAAQTYLQRVTATVNSINPTFFSNWLGNNDVLGYATAGGYSGTITTPAEFADKNSKIIDALTAKDAKGVVATIPDVTAVPFFTTVGPTLRQTLTDRNVPGIVALTGSGSTRKPIAREDIRNSSGGRQLITLTAAPYLTPTTFGLPGGRYWRELAASQLRNPATGAINQADYRILLSALLTSAQVDTTKAFGVSAENPLPSALVLDDVEQALIAAATTDYNNAIRAKADAKGLAIFNANAFFTSIGQSGFATNGVNNTASFISGNLFSLDGVHPTPRGYAVVANEMIRVINEKYGSTIPFVNPNAYRGVLIP